MARKRRKKSYIGWILKESFSKKGRYIWEDDRALILIIHKRKPKMMKSTHYIKSSIMFKEL